LCACAIGRHWQGIAIANNVFATADPLLKNACDYISMAESGKYYAFSAISEFQSIANGEIIYDSYQQSIHNRSNKKEVPLSPFISPFIMISTPFCSKTQLVD
jgi:hypothetical protein